MRHAWETYGIVDPVDVCQKCGLRREHRLTFGHPVFGSRKRRTVIYWQGKEYLGKNIKLPSCL